MVFNAREADHVAHVYDLVRSLFDVMRDVLKSTQVQSMKKDEAITEIQESKADSQIKMVKNVEIVIDVFKKAAEKVGKVGERDWREVIEQQSYVLEELISMQEHLLKVGITHKAYKQAHTNFELALSDFKFCLNKALESLVQKDDDQDIRMIQSTKALPGAELK